MLGDVPEVGALQERLQRRALGGVVEVADDGDALPAVAAPARVDLADAGGLREPLGVVGRRVPWPLDLKWLTSTSSGLPAGNATSYCAQSRLNTLSPPAVRSSTWLRSPSIANPSRVSSPTSIVV
jgi:hypothetical protein